VQEFIPPGGDTLGVELLMDHGKRLAHFMHKRLREFPVHGGPSTLRESIYDGELLAKATQLLASIEWHGVAMVEFKVDPRDGVAKLMEINPKFWGSIALAIVSGVNFPLLLYQLATGQKVDSFSPYRLNVRCRWLLPGDILHFIANPDRWKLKPSFFDFRGEFDDLVEAKDLGPLYGMLLGFGSKFFTKKVWTEKIFRAH
jgi:predicted ATP-grasp superfamily ATP-dependent carboligase